MITLLRGGWLAAWDGTQHRIIERGEVAFEDDRILYAGPHFAGQAETSWIRSCATGSRALP